MSHKTHPYIYKFTNIPVYAPYYTTVLVSGNLYLELLPILTKSMH